MVKTKPEDLQALIGLSEADAKAAIEKRGETWRVSCRDGNSFILTCDYHTYRINLSVQGGKVIDATRG